MKYVLLIILSVSCVMFGSCEKGDDYYYNYQKSDQFYDGSIYNYLMEQGGTYDSLAFVLERLPALKEKLNQTDRKITFFALNNRSFEIALENLNFQREINGLNKIYLEDIDLAVLDTLAHRYVFDEELPVAGFSTYQDGRSVFSAKYDYEMHVLYEVLTASGLVDGGQQQLTFSDVNGSIYERYWNSTVTATVDFKTKNGVIHTLAPRHEFGFGKLTTYLSKK